MVMGSVAGLSLGIENGSEDDNFMGTAVGIPEIISVVEASKSVNGFLVYIFVGITVAVAAIDKLLGLCDTYGSGVRLEAAFVIGVRVGE